MTLIRNVAASVLIALCELGFQSAQAGPLFGGHVLSVEKAGNGYRVKLLRDGEVRVIVVH